MPLQEDLRSELMGFSLRTARLRLRRSVVEVEIGVEARRESQ